MAQQCLDRPQVSARRQQVCGEGMAQGMGRGSVRQAEHAAQLLYQSLDQARVQRAALGTPEQRAGFRQRIGADGRISVDGLPHRGDQRHDTHLAALAADAQAFRRGQVCAGQVQRL